MKLNMEELKGFLDEKTENHNMQEFIESGPVSIPHLYSIKEDIEISGILTATISWGNRVSILRNAKRLTAFLDDSPYEFILHLNGSDLEKIKVLIHRTFNSADLIYFIKALRHKYKTKKGLEGIFNEYRTDDTLQPAIHQFYIMFFELPQEKRMTRLVSYTLKGSAATK
jgi:uncharacterized protein (TIGR02757 family)